MFMGLKEWSSHQVGCIIDNLPEGFVPFVTSQITDFERLWLVLRSVHENLEIKAELEVNIQ